MVERTQSLCKPHIGPLYDRCETQLPYLVIISLRKLWIFMKIIKHIYLIFHFGGTKHKWEKIRAVEDRENERSKHELKSFFLFFFLGFWGWGSPINLILKWLWYETTSHKGHRVHHLWKIKDSVHTIQPSIQENMSSPWCSYDSWVISWQPYLPSFWRCLGTFFLTGKLGDPLDCLSKKNLTSQ